MNETLEKLKKIHETTQRCTKQFRETESFVEWVRSMTEYYEENGH